MNVYLSNIETAAIAFPVLALLITLPYMIVQYRKFGAVPRISSLIVYTFAFYALCAYFMVILPLPKDHTAVVAYAQTPQLHLFDFIRQIAHENTATLANPATWPSFFKVPAVYKAAFNVVLTLPLGAYLRYCFRCRWWQALAIGFGTTLFFEFSQLTGLWGLYAHPYRLFDVDDLLLNTTGTLIGWIVAGPFMRSLPDLRALRVEAREEGRRASATHRALSFGIDMAIMAVLESVVTFCAGAILKPISGQRILAGMSDATPWVFIASFALLFVIVPALTKGQTIGQRICRLRIVRPDAAQAHWYHYLARYGLLYLLTMLPLCAILWVLSLGHDAASGNQLVAFILHNRKAAVMAWCIGMLSWAILLLIRATISAVRKEPFVMLNGLLSSTRVMTEAGVQSAREQRRALSVAETRELEKRIAQEGTPLATLMKRAGLATAQEAIAWMPDPHPVVVFAGSGNNGGDGWVCAAELAKNGYPVTLITPEAAEDIAAQPAHDAATAAFDNAMANGLPLRVLVDPPIADVRKALDKARIVIDGMLGTGFSGDEVLDPYADWIDEANLRRFRGKSSKRNGRHALAYKNIRHAAAQKLPDKAHNAPVAIAIDVPSGLNADTGRAAAPCFVADATVVMLSYKTGLVEKTARPWTGTCTLASLDPDSCGGRHRRSAADPDDPTANKPNRNDTAALSK